MEAGRPGPPGLQTIRHGFTRRRTFTKRLVKVRIPVPIVDQREVRFH